MTAERSRSVEFCAAYVSRKSFGSIGRSNAYENNKSIQRRLRMLYILYKHVCTYTRFTDQSDHRFVLNGGGEHVETTNNKEEKKIVSLMKRFGDR